MIDEGTQLHTDVVIIGPHVVADDFIGTCSHKALQNCHRKTGTVFALRAMDQIRALVRQEEAKALGQSFLEFVGLIDRAHIQGDRIAAGII